MTTFELFTIAATDGANWRGRLDPHSTRHCINDNTISCCSYPDCIYRFNSKNGAVRNFSSTDGYKFSKRIIWYNLTLEHKTDYILQKLPQLTKSTVNLWLWVSCCNSLFSGQSWFLLQIGPWICRFRVYSQNFLLWLLSKDLNIIQILEKVLPFFRIFSGASGTWLKKHHLLIHQNKKIDSTYWPSLVTYTHAIINNHFLLKEDISFSI